jgi:WD40 repeat protein
MNPLSLGIVAALALPSSRLGEPGFAVAAELSPRGDALAIGDELGGVHVLDLGSRVLHRLRAATGSPCLRIAWSANGEQLAVREQDGRLEVCDAADGRVAWSVHSVAWTGRGNPDFWFQPALVFADSDGVLLVAGGMDAVQLRNTRDGVLIAEIGPESGPKTGAAGPKVSAIALDAQRMRVVVGDVEGCVRLYATKNGAPLPGEWSVPKPVNPLAIPQAGDAIAVGGGDSLVRILELEGRGPVREFSHADMNLWGDLQVGHVAFSDDGRRLVVSTFSCWGMRCWDVDSGLVCSDYDTWTGGPCSYPAFVADEGRTMFGGLLGVVRKMRDPTPDRVLVPREYWTRFAACGRYAWSITSEKRQFVVYDLHDDVWVFAIGIDELERGPESVRRVRTAIPRRTSAGGSTQAGIGEGFARLIASGREEGQHPKAHPDRAQPRAVRLRGGARGRVRIGERIRAGPHPSGPARKGRVPGGAGAPGRFEEWADASLPP